MASGIGGVCDSNIFVRSPEVHPDVVATNKKHYSQPSAAGLLLSTQTDDAVPDTDPEGAQARTDETSHQVNPNQTHIPNPSIHVELVDNVSPDLWSAAYREAVESLGKDIDIAILKGRNVAELFRQLGEINDEATQESAFLKGVRFLESIQVPLGKFKMALDLATPLTSLDPAVSTVFGMVRSVTAVAITLSTADEDFAKQIAAMLEQIAYIDDCDTLGQKVDKKDIHKALVLVYKKLLEFYSAAYEILSRRGANVIVRLILENGHLPEIVQDFLRQADTLRKLVQKATLEIVEDIKAMLYDQEIGRWLGSSAMRQQSQYHAYLQDLRAAEACEFLVRYRNFINWYSASNSQHLALLGEMGSGKTVAMGFLVDELRRRSENQIPQNKVCFYYCQNGGPDQAVQILSCLILSLLEQLPGLKKRFYGWYKQAQASGNFEPATDTKKLREFLQRLLEAIDRQVFFVIDGLDECDRTSRGVILKCLGTLSQKISRLKVLLSFRPHDEILGQAEGMPQLQLGCAFSRDSVIVRKAVETHLSCLPKDVEALVIEKVSQLAKGNAIWTKMVIELIQTRGIMAIGPMRLFLDEVPVPTQLSALYTMLLSRCTSNEPENEHLARKALAILAVARRPLSILELAWAVAMGTAQPEVTTVAALSDWVDHQRLINLIHPFIARLNFGDLKKRQVRLIHQSVRAFVVEQWTDHLQTGTTSASTDRATLHRRTESLEGLLLEICINYLQLEEIGTTAIFPEEQVAMEALPRDVDLFNDDDLQPNDALSCSWEDLEHGMARYDPADRGFGEFFVYASCHWMHHFGAVTNSSLPSLASIESLCQAGSTRLDNWVQQNCRPDCAIQPRFEFDSSLYDPLSITSLYGSEAMLRGMLEKSDFGEDKFLPNPLIGAATQILQWGDFPRLKILLESKHGHQLQNLDFFRLIIKRWSAFATQFKDWDQVFDHVDYVLDISVREQWAGKLLSLAAGARCMPIVRRLVTRAQQNAALKEELMRGLSCEEPQRNVLRAAVQCGDLDLISFGK
ncbi:hypothetical protein BHE90_001195 [Fusarium euwallaceae]|uniref:NACHT domain-containing protein n=1 Tax=Fusarium euwallaceae TaxID=1147111 RepID=A0A430M8P7_9HYPO|nr:hypothetical protein BHE90_001195 [Fusarium euwallaceae]